MAVVSIRHEARRPLAKPPANGKHYVGLLVGGLDSHNYHLYGTFLDDYGISIARDWTEKFVPPNKLPQGTEVVIVLMDSKTGRHMQAVLALASMADVPIVRVLRRGKAQWKASFEAAGFLSPPPFRSTLPPVQVRKPAAVAFSAKPTPVPEGDIMDKYEALKPPPAPAVTFGDMLRMLRKAEGLSASKLAQTLDPPMDGWSVCQYEKGHHLPSLATFQQFAMLFPELANHQPPGLRGPDYTPTVKPRAPVVVVESLTPAEEKPALVQTVLTLSPMDVAAVAPDAPVERVITLSTEKFADLKIVEETPTPAIHFVHDRHRRGFVRVDGVLPGDRGQKFHVIRCHGLANGMVTVRSAKHGVDRHHR